MDLAHEGRSHETLTIAQSGWSRLPRFDGFVLAPSVENGAAGMPSVAVGVAVFVTHSCIFHE